MKRQYHVRVLLILAVFVFAFIYTLPSTSVWDTLFGALTIDEQYAVPQSLISYSKTPDNAAGLITFKYDPSAGVLSGESKVTEQDILNSVIDLARKRLSNASIAVSVPNPDYSNKQAQLRFPGITAEGELRAALQKVKLYSSLPLEMSRVFPRRKINLGLDLQGGMDLVYEIDRSSLQEGDTPQEAVRRSVEIIRNRIDLLGIAEPSIKAQGTNRIRVQLPGVKDPERVKGVIQSTAMLKFHLVIDSAPTTAQLTNVDAQEHLVLPEYDPKSKMTRWYKLKREPEVTGRDLKFAQVGFDDLNNSVVHLTFNPEGAAKFAMATGKHVGEQLAIVLDNRVHSAPVIQSRITGGMAQITGHFTPEEAHGLAIVLRAGALPATLVPLGGRIVGPTLGEQSIRQGMRAGIVGTLLVVVFMILYYKSSGMIANLAVLFNVMIVFSSLVMFGGTMTLPGIAGLILSIGMAVDANILVFERIREELRAGKTVRAAIDAGYDRAWVCILDSNITTLLTCLVLYIWGTGPVRGFAVTLGIGLMANLFTAIFVCKVAMDLLHNQNKSQTMSI